LFGGEKGKRMGGRGPDILRGKESQEKEAHHSENDKRKGQVSRKTEPPKSTKKCNSSLHYFQRLNKHQKRWLKHCDFTGTKKTWAPRIVRRKGKMEREKQIDRPEEKERGKIIKQRKKKTVPRQTTKRLFSKKKGYERLWAHREQNPTEKGRSWATQRNLAQRKLEKQRP